MSSRKGFSYLTALGVDVNDVIKNYVNRKLDREPVKSFDGIMYDALKPFLRSNPSVASQVEKAIKDERITKNFCSEKALYDQIHRFIDSETFAKSMFSNENYQAAWSLLREMIPIPLKKLTPLQITRQNVVDTFSNPDASSGILAYPKHKSEVTDLIYDVAAHIMENYDKSFSLPAIALTRSQITDFINDKGEIDSSQINHKTRLVLCVDAASVLVEQRLGQPILDCVMKACRQYAGGHNDNDIAHFLLDVCKNKHWVSLDYSKFDASIQAWLIYDVFKFLAEFYPESENKAFEWIAHNFVDMQVLMPNGSMVNLHKGIKSGSYFTQIVGSLCNIIMILTYLVHKYGVKAHGRLDLTNVRNQLKAQNNSSPLVYTMMAMGDDNIIFTYDELDVVDMSKYLYKCFRAKITVEGEKAFDSGGPSDAPCFLKRIWTKRGQFRDDLDMWVNLLHPERRRSYKGYSPYHILFGYFLTFKGTMGKYVSYMTLVNLMHKAPGGIDAIAQIKLRELPGSLRSQILSRGVKRADFVKEVKSNLIAS